MTLVISKGITLRKGWQPMDSDAAAYITAVETADTEPLEERTKIAIDNFVLGCKADGIWNAIKASCIMAGARTRLGAMVPLVGPAPTSFNFVNADYNRKTGLVGNGSTKYLDSNRNNNADPQNSNHNAVYVSTVHTNGAGIHLGTSTNAAGSNTLGNNQTDAFTRSRSFASSDWGVALPGFFAANRFTSGSYVVRVNGQSQTSNTASDGLLNENLMLYRRGSGIPNFAYSSARLAFYSIGESLNLALLDARVTALINAFGAAIP